MKTLASLILTLLIAVSAPARALDARFNDHHYQHQAPTTRWVVPLVVGGIIGYALGARENPARPRLPALIVDPSAAPVFERHLVYDYACGCYFYRGIFVRIQ